MSVHEEGEEKGTILDETGGDVSLSHGRGIGTERKCIQMFL